MDCYEKMRNAFVTELSMALPDLLTEATDIIAAALDRAAQGYEVVEKETALALRTESIPAIVKTYIAVKKTEGLSDATLSNYVRTLKAFFGTVRKIPEEVTANDIRLYLYEYQKARGVSNRTLDKYREMICWFFSWAHNEEYLNRNPARSVKAIKAEIKQRQALTQLELERLRLACRTPRERAMVEFMYSTGCRVSEMAAVTIKDIDLRAGTVHLLGKGRKHRTSYINAKCEIAIEEYLKVRPGDSGYLFVSERAPYRGLRKGALEKVVRTLAERSGVEKHITPHILRHTTATQAVNNGMPIEEVSKLLGHASVATTMIYAKSSQEVVHTHHTRCIV